MKPAIWITLAALALAAPATATPATATPKTASSDVPAAAVLASVPMLPSHQVNRVIVDLARPGQRPFPLMLDTGASDSFLTPRYARKLGVIVRRAQERPYQRSTVLGRDLQFWVDTSWSNNGSRTGWEIGLLGGEFVSRYVLELDFGARRVRFLDPERFAVPVSVSAPDEAVLPLRVVGNRPLVHVKVDGRPVQVLLDTGDYTPMILTGESAQHAGISVPMLADLGLGGVWGRFDAYLTEATGLDIGPFHFAPVPMVFAPNGNFNMGGSRGTTLGSATLEQFDVRIDYPHRRLWLKREGHRPSAWLDPWKRIRSQRTGVGLSLGHEGVEVSAVRPDSPAARLGLRAGDRLVSQDDESHAREVADLLHRIEAGQPITVSRTENGVPVQEVLGPKEPAPRSR